MTESIHMVAENPVLNHPKSIWYHIGSERWWYLPDVQDIPVRIRKNIWQFCYNGGHVEIDLVKSASILFYGSNQKTGALPIQFITECAEANVSLVFHRNHVPQPAVLYANRKIDRHDVLTQQILTREDSKKRAYIARTLVKWQWRHREWLGPCTSSYSNLAAARSAEQVMILEAQAARDYWSVYYAKLELPDVGRRLEHPVNAALDALSHFLSGLTLRWILSHGLSPAHGYLHKQTGYPSLVYDLMEISRWWTEKAVFDAYRVGGEHELVERATHLFKQRLEEAVHSEPTRQNVYRKTLIQGGVIALVHYLTGRMKHFLPPVEETEKARGRKRNCTYTLPGQIWTM